MLKWIAQHLSGVLGAEQAEVKVRLEALELSHSALVERFKRLQSQLAMRYAREVGAARDEALRLSTDRPAVKHSIFDDL